MLPRRQRRPGLAAAVGAAAAAFALAGCGGQPATRASVIARGDAICASTGRALANLPAANGASGTTVNFVKAAPIVTREAKTLSALPRPAADRALLERFVAAESQLAAGYRHLASLQRTADENAVRNGIAALARNDAAALAHRYGLTQCSAEAATVH